MKKLLEWWNTPSYIWKDPGYKKYAGKIYLLTLLTSIVGAIILAFWQPEMGDANKWQLVFLMIWILIIGFCLGSVNAVRDADEYQFKKDNKNDKIPTV